ncbi:MAG: hypothetical protein ACQERF_09850 [Actinomycetota bacterium]
MAQQGRGTRAVTAPGKPGHRRPRSKAMYWRRRALVLVGVALIGVGVVWGMSRLFGVLGDAWAAAVSEQQSAATPTGISTAQPVACPSDGLAWELTHDASGAGSAVRFALTVTNISGEACLVDAGAGTLVLTVVSGEDLIWSNAHCGSSDPVLLLLGPEDSTTRTVTWTGTRSAPGCGSVAAAVRPGTYQVGLDYATVEVPGAAAVFTLR